MLIVAPKELIGLWFFHSRRPPLVVEKYPLTPTMGQRAGIPLPGISHADT
jgi:hypothetical protein